MRFFYKITIIFCLIFFTGASLNFAASAPNNAKPNTQNNAANSAKNPIQTQGKPIPKELKEGEHSVKLGDTMEKHLKFFGRPRVILNNGESYTWRSWINLYSPELVIKLKPSKVIWQIIADHLPMIKTPEGIGFGNTKEEIEQVYGKSKGYVAPNGDLVMAYGGDPVRDPFMRFRLSGEKEKRVIYMIIGHYNIDVKQPPKKKGKKGKKRK